MSHELLHPALRDAIANLLIDDQAACDRTAAVAEDVLPIVCKALAHVLVDPDAMREFFLFVESLGLRYPYRHEPLMESSRQDEVVAHGLGCLTGEELAVLALNPLQLMALRDRLEEDEVEPNDAWWPVYRQFHPATSIIAQVFEEHAEEIEAAVRTPAAEAFGRELAGAFFGEREDSTAEAAPPAQRRQRWATSVALDGKEVAWSDVVDPQAVERDRGLKPRIEFTYYPERSQGQLEVRFGLPLLLVDAVGCTCRLLDADGQALLGSDGRPLEGRVEPPKVVFDLVPGPLAAARLAIVYADSKKYRVTLVAPLQWPSRADD